MKLAFQMYQYDGTSLVCSTPCQFQLQALFTFFHRPAVIRNATEITSTSGLPYRPSSALRQQLHSPAMRLLSRLEDERSCSANWSTYFVRIP